jgi:hypothetical protein
VRDADRLIEIALLDLSQDRIDRPESRAECAGGIELRDDSLGGVAKLRIVPLVKLPLHPPTPHRRPVAIMRVTRFRGDGSICIGKQPLELLARDVPVPSLES